MPARGSLLGSRFLGETGWVGFLELVKGIRNRVADRTLET
jgi:hypothetical protein